MAELIENIRNGKCQLINKNWISKDLVNAKDVYQSINECHVFTEQDLFTNTISIDKVKQAREEIADRIDNYPDRNISEYEDCIAILDRLIAESEGE